MDTAALHEPHEALDPPSFASEGERLDAFARALDQLRKDVEAQLGEADVAHVERIAALSRRMEWLGRFLLHASIEPVGFTAGVAALWLHKTLELMEIGHTVLHGTYDHVPGAEAFHADRFRWKAPIDEESWRASHNVRHHQYTNIAGRDPDLDFGGLRLSPRIPHRLVHVLQPITNLGTWTAFAAAINLHATGLLEVYARSDASPILPDRTWRSLWQAHQRAFRKYVPYYAREYVFFPLLAGPFFWKPLLGNFLTEVGRDVYAGATIYCGHVGAADFAPGTRAQRKGRWYAMQVEAARNFEVSLPVSILCGALNLQIEHHLFPRLPPNRLRELAPRVRALCEAHGVKYRSASWGTTLRDVLGKLRELARPGTQRAALA
jgi:fatty acid desaturase